MPLLRLLFVCFVGSVFVGVFFWMLAVLDGDFSWLSQFLVVVLTFLVGDWFWAVLSGRGSRFARLAAFLDY